MIPATLATLNFYDLICRVLPEPRRDLFRDGISMPQGTTQTRWPKQWMWPKRYATVPLGERLLYFMADGSLVRLNTRDWSLTCELLERPTGFIILAPTRFKGEAEACLRDLMFLKLLVG